MRTDDRKARARSRAEAKFGFYKHLAAYVAVNLLLIVINLATWPGYFWAIWPLIGWGIAIAIHAMSVFVFGRNNEIVERLTEEEMRNDKTTRE
jgi:hypothetical protein